MDDTLRFQQITKLTVSRIEVVREGSLKTRCADLSLTLTEMVMLICKTLPVLRVCWNLDRHLSSSLSKKD